MADGGWEHGETDYRRVFEECPTPILVVDGARVARAGNRAARELEIELGALLADERLDELVSGLGRGEAASEVEVSVLDRHGRARTFSVTGRALDPIRSVLALSETTVLRARDEQLAQLRRLDSLGLITASVVHDLNNMLTPILCLSTLLAREGEPGAPLVREMRSAAERAAGLVRQLLAFGRRAPSRVTRLNPADVLAELHPLVERVAGQDVEIIVDLDAAAGDVSVDREQLEQVVLNLVANARDAMPRGGRIRIATALAAADGQPGDIAIAVSDTGSGMTPETRRNAFEPLFTTKSHGLGAGLGLATARRFARESRGRIALESEPGAGTTVTLYLPRADGAATAAPRRRATPLPRGSETVLVVDDDAGVLETARLTLEEHGYRVLCARSGEDALDMVTARGEGVHLLLVDVVMRGIGGGPLVDAIGATSLRPKVVFMSGYADEKLGQLGVRPSADPLLRKAFTSAELVRVVRAVLDS